MKARMFYIIAILIIIILFIFFKSSSSCQRLSCISMDGISNFQIKDIYIENKTNFRSLYIYENILLRVEVISQPDQFSASQFLAANISQVKGLFTDSLAPYPGTISNTITCEDRYKPKFDNITTDEKLEISFFIAYLNSNLTYGSCTEGQTTNKGISAYFYCPKNKLVYHLELISPTKDFESSPATFQEMIESIKCK